MKKIRIVYYSIIFVLVQNTTMANLISTPATGLSSLLQGRLASANANQQPSPPSVFSSHPVTLASSSSGSTFPLPEGVATPPPALSPAITSAITPVLAAAVTPELITMIKSEMPLETPPAETEAIANFQPVGAPTEISTIDLDTIPPATETNAALPIEKKMPILIPKQKSFKGSFDITSLYVFRGISRSGNSPAFQGDFTYTFLPTGIYLKIWGSNVDFLSRQGQQATVEADTIAGVKNKIGHDFTYDLRMVRYNFAKAAGANYNEFVSFLQYRILTFTLGYSPNAFNAHANGLYFNGGFDIPIPAKYTFQYTDVSVLGHYGHYYLSEEVGLRSYSDFLLGLQKVFKPYTFRLLWKGTNGEAHQKGLDANRLVGTIFVDF